MHENTSCRACRITRRHFLKVAVATSAAMACSRSSFGAQPHSSPPDASLLAACGIFCGACESFLKSRDAGQPSEVQCLGCWSKEKPPAYGPKCSVLSCCKNKKINTCGECVDFPCPTIEKFYVGGPKYELREKYLWEIKRNGRDRWLEEQKKRWSCPVCGASFGYGDKRCKRCGRPVLTAEQELNEFKKTRSSDTSVNAAHK